MTAALGKLIAGRYRIESLIASGGVGSVYRATQEILNRPVAIKTLRAELAREEHVRRRFVREAQAIAQLHHPAIATVFDFGSDEDGELYLAMEFVEGQSLADFLERSQAPFSTLRSLFDQILAGLEHAHARGVIHRDIKPANVLIEVDHDGTLRARIVDFGIATRADVREPSTDGEAIVGTPHFMAPEQARGEAHLTPAVDIYTTGLMLYWATTGKHAFSGRNAREVMEAQVSHPMPAPVWREGMRVPDALRGLLEEVLEKDPRRRLPSASLFRSRLRALSGAALPSLVEAQVRPRQGGIASARGSTLMETTAHTLHDDLRDRTLDQEEVVERVGDTGPPQGEAPATVRGDIPFVGRDEERTLLIETANKVLSESRGRIVTLEGESGLGKSKLATWLLEQLTEVMGYKAGHGAFSREGERGLRGLREGIETLLGVRGLSTEELGRRVQDKLHFYGVRDADDHRELIAFLRPRLNERDLEAGHAKLEALFELLVRVLAAASLDAPIVLSLEDVHWAGPEFAAFVGYLGAELQRRECRILLLLTVQTEDLGDDTPDLLIQRLSRYQGQTVLRRRLRRIDEDQARRLVHSMLNASPALVTELVERAAGNPMHLVQLVRYLREENLVEWSASGWQPRAGVEVGELLPPSLADTLKLRIEHFEAQPEIGARAREILNRSAILGMSFSFRVLEALLRLEGRQDLLAQLDSDVDRILDEELMVMRPKRDDDQLLFPTSLIRDVILQRLRNRRTTRTLHGLAAEAKLQTCRGEEEKIAAELVQHYQQARMRREELRFALKAAGVAERNHRPNDAITHYRRCLRLLEEVPEAAAEIRHDASRSHLHLRIALLSTGFGELERAARHFHRILNDEGAPTEHRVRARFGLADLAWMQGRFDEAETLAREALDATPPSEEEDTLRLRAQGLLALARVAWHRGQTERTQSLVHQAAELAEISGDREQRAEVTWFRADLARGRGEIAEAELLFTEALEGFRSLNLQRGIAKCHAKLAVTARMKNDLDHAAECYRAALEIYERLGARRGVAHQLNGLGDVARFRGDTELAADHYRRAVDIFQSIGVPFDAAIALTNLGLVARDSGDMEGAEDAFRRALTVSEAIGYSYLVLGVKLNLAWLLALRGDETGSNKLLEESLALTDEVELVDPDFALPLESLGQLKDAAGHVEEAQFLYRKALVMWEGMGRMDDHDRVARRIAGQEDAGSSEDAAG